MGKHFILRVAVAAAMVLGYARHGIQAQQAGSTPRAAKLDITPASFAKLHALIRPHASEWRHLRVRWLTDVVAARTKAASEDKPIIILYTGGAGYNEPLGVC